MHMHVFSLFKMHDFSNGTRLRALMRKRGLLMSDRLLIVDDEAEFGRFAGHVGELAGYEVTVTSNGQDFKKSFSEWKPTVIILDLSMPDMDGLELLRWLASENCHAQLVIMSGFDARVVEAAKLVGEERGLNIRFAISKPVRVREMKEKLESLKAESATQSEASSPQEDKAAPNS